MENTVYLDNSATTPLAPEVVERMERVRAETFGNASSVHRLGQRARYVIEEARERIARSLGAEAREIVFTSGGTEADNLALKGFAFATYVQSGIWPAIITATTEHHAVLAPAEFLRNIGAAVHHVTVDDTGRTDTDELRSALAAVGPGPALVSLMHGNNETGAVNPIDDLARAAHAHGAVFHSDAVQTLGKLPIGLAGSDVDLMSFSAHKIHGPKGIGALFVRRTAEIEPLLHGGPQERNRRGGTEPVELIAGFDEALALALRNGAEDNARMTSLREQLRARIAARVDGVRFVTPSENVLPTILDLTFDDADRLDGEGLIVGMDLRGVAVSNGAACTSGSLQPSHVLAAIGLSAAQARVAVRFSLSRYTTEVEIERAVEALTEVVGTMRGRSRGL